VEVAPTPEVVDMSKSSRLFVLVALVALSAAFWSGPDSQAQEKKGKGGPPPLPKWEYKVTVLGGEDQETEKELNKLGDEGWELVGTPSQTTARPAGMGGAGAISTKVRLIFKRPKP
jgi:hypothetical protein